MAQDHPLNHPFPYFGLRVTRDLGAIAQAIQKKYEVEKQFEIRQPERYRRFSEYVNLFNKEKGRGTGNYPPDSDLINARVDKCLAQLDPMLLSMAHPTTRTIHPEQHKFLVAAARDTFLIDEQLAVAYLNDLMREKAITQDEKVPPPPPPTPPRPVTHLRYELGDRRIRILWNKPDSHCEYVLIHRRDWPEKRTETARGSEWTDGEVLPGEKYIYSISSVYGTALPSGTNQVQAVARGVVESFSASSSANTATLKWANPPNTQRVTLLRSTTLIRGVVEPASGTFCIPAGEVTPIELKDSATEFTDKDLTPGRTYFYVVVARHRDQICSASECRSVTIGTAPPPPKKDEVKTEVHPGRVYLAWPASRTGHGVIYRVTRSETASLTGDTSREPCWRSKTSTFEDKTVVPGAFYWYFIELESEGVISQHSTGVGPIVAVGEVENLRAIPSPAQVELQWKAPPRAKRVDVFRAVGKAPDHPLRPSPTAPGTPLTVVSKGNVIDAELENDKTYYYRVMCVFATPDGGEIVTPGEAVSATPGEMPVAVRRIRAQYDGGVAITWDNSAKAIVQVVRTAKYPAQKPGTVVALNLMKQFGEQLPQATLTGATDLEPRAEEPFYLVFVANRHQAIYCGSAFYWQISSLTVEPNHANVVVKWRWPEGCTAITLTHDVSSSTKDRSESRTQTIERVGRDSKEIYLPAQPAGLHRIQVQCLPPAKGANVAIGPPQTKEVKVGGATSVQWCLVRDRGWPFGSGSAKAVRIVANGVFNNIHRLRLVAQRVNIPTAVHDGELIAEWDPESTGFPEQNTLELPLRAWSASKGQPVYCRLFVEPESAKVIPPATYHEMKL
jgi:hypothetical protein